MNKDKWFKMPVAAHLVLKRGDEVLMLLRANTGFEDGKYSVVAGHLDGNEPAKAAMIREAKEEAGIDLSYEDLSVVCVVHRKAPDRESIDFFYAADTWKGDIQNMEPDKCAELKFFPVSKLPSNTIEYVREAIEASEKGIRYLEFGWE